MKISTNRVKRTCGQLICGTIAAIHLEGIKVYLFQPLTNIVEERTIFRTPASDWWMKLDLDR
jgi:hypothetical protein